MAEGYRPHIVAGDTIRFAFKIRPEPWTRATVLEEVPMESQPEHRFYRVLSHLPLGRTETVLVGTRRFNIEKI